MPCGPRATDKEHRMPRIIVAGLLITLLSVGGIRYAFAEGACAVQPFGSLPDAGQTTSCGNLTSLQRSLTGPG
jgi:hypothetical protein